MTELTMWIWNKTLQSPLGLLVCLQLLAAAPTEAQVTSDMLVRADERPGDWTMYSGQYHSQRFSRLAQIDRSTVGGLELAWVRQLDTLGQVQTSPLVVDDVMYVTTPENEVLALDAATGQVFWSYVHPLEDVLTLCCGKQSRGVAMLGNTLYLATMDARLVALDAATGNVVWNTKVANPLDGYSLTAAPLVVHDLVITGIAGGEFGIRGFVDAYDAKTGARRWRTYMIPGEGEPENDTWDGDSWKTGGASTWQTGAYDPALNLVYWGVGNPGPDWNGETRMGDNLYSDSVVAMDGDTGEIRWHFQFTPHDVHDWDACQTPVLVDAMWEGQPRKLMYWANRNAFFYVLDRETGEFLSAFEYAEQTWAERIDAQGRPVRVPGMEPSREGRFVAPEVGGASNWWSPSYSPETELFYTMAYDGGAIYYSADAEYEPGKLFVGGSYTRAKPVDEYHSAIRAIDPTTGARRWEFPVRSKSMAGVMATAGGLVFAGTVRGNFLALDAETGANLWRRPLGGEIIAAPVTYLSNSRQQVTIAAGHAIFTFALPE
ncbi:MAG: PQQ-dependent dehydrogenase, methanol/ethanol family [Vicinamibacterales bacterium]|nr:PQQ-dependent dehydrogenase, methanol/ethanol family [Vicinamibacterales bacterium]